MNRLPEFGSEKSFEMLVQHPLFDLTGQVTLVTAAASGLGLAYCEILAEHGARVVMIGDGMNDGPGLSIADVSVAMGQGAPITQARSDVLLLSNRLIDFSYAVMMCTRALYLIKQNLYWAVAYNLLAIPAAVTGLIEPWHAAIGMSLSSLIVVANSLRLLITTTKNNAD